jgi:hypothetical protein
VSPYCIIDRDERDARSLTVVDGARPAFGHLLQIHQFIDRRLETLIHLVISRSATECGAAHKVNLVVLV